MKNYYRISVLAFVALFCFAFNSVRAQVIKTIAGNGTGAFYANGGLADTSKINNPMGMAIDKAGNVFFIDYSNNRIREIVRATGKIAAVAGTGVVGNSGDGAAATAATFNYPTGIALDTAGNIFIADIGNNRVRKITKATQVISAVVGNGSSVFTPGNPASSQGMVPHALAVDDSGNVYISDKYNQRVYKLYTSIGKIVSIAGNGKGQYYADGGKADTSSINAPGGIALDKHKNLYIADDYNIRVRMVTFSTNVISTVAGNGTSGYPTMGGQATATPMGNPIWVSVDTVTGNLYVVDSNYSMIHMVNGTTGIIQTIAGNGGFGYYGDGMEATLASLNNPAAVTADDSGNVYIADMSNQRIRKVNVTGPAITSQPNSPYFCDHSSAKIGITVSGTGTTYQWFVDSNYATKWVKLTNAGFYTGVTTDTLRMSYINSANNNEYRCVIDNGYDTSQSTYLNITSLPTVTLTSPTDSICPGAPNNLIASIYMGYIAERNHQAVYAGGGTYRWSTGDSTDTITVRPYITTTYTVAATQNSCTTDTSIVVMVDRTKISYTAFPSTTICAGNNLTLFGKGGTGSYSWSGGASNAVAFSPVSTTTYTVTGIDGMGCTLKDSLKVTVNPSPTVTVTSSVPKDTICAGSTITLTGNGAVTYSWTGGVTNGAAFSPLSSAVYYLTGTNANGCSETISVPVVVNALPVVTGTASSDAVCKGSSLTLTGNGAASYTWSGSVTNGVAFAPSASGSYTVTGTDAHGCIGSAAVNITVNTLPVISSSALPSAVVCQGASLALYGGGGASYSWSGGVNNGASFTPVSTTTYTVTGTDANGCSGKDSIIVTVNASPTVTVTSSVPKDTICTGSAITLTGNGAVTYNWSGGITNGVAFSPASSAVYNLTGTGADGCSASLSVPVVVNTLPIVTGTASPGAVCKGATLVLSGNGAVSYSWSGGVTNAVAFAPAASGSYTVTGTDAHGCSGSAAVNITVNTLPVISASAFPAAVLCQGSSLALFGAGGASYSWSGGVNNGVSFTPSASNTYTVTGIDANGCTAKDSIHVTVHHKVVPTLTSNNTTCGLKNGSATVSASNGIPPYTYSWSTNPAKTTTSVDSLAPGTYVVSVSDSANCASSAAVSISASTAPILSVSTTNSNCGSQGTGSAAVAVTGGNAPYRYMWNNGDTLATNYNLRAATYIITVTDVNGCSSFAPAIVSNVNGPKISTLSTVNVKCYGDASGAINISVSGGTPPYHYLWSNGATTSSISALFAGPYQLVVVDVDSCTSVENFTITQPLALSVASSSVKADCGISNGSASVSVTGGLAPYTYKWSNGITANVDASVSAGVYDVIIKDANGCADSNLVSVSNKTGPALAISVSNNASCGSGGLLSVLATGGTSPYTYKWNNGVTASSISNVPAGNYYVSVTDAKGCVGSADTSVSEVLPPALSLCMVTVDPLAGKHNYIIWDKSKAKKISHYNIYKESTSAGVYFKIDSVPMDSAGIYVDLLSDATVRSWRYKISQVDSCGNESPLSPAHKTMHLTVNQGVGHNINLIWDNYEGLNFSTYYVYRDTIPTKFTLIDSIPNNIFTYTDNNFPYSTKPFLYRIGISNPGGCNPAIQAINYNASKSNTGNFTFNGSAGIAAIGNDNSALLVFPNPNNGVFTITLNAAKGSHSMVLSVINTLGQVVSTTNYSDVQASFSKQLDLSSLAKGVYFIKLASDNQTLYNKVVIQ